jgi:hypothetical protein
MSFIRSAVTFHNPSTSLRVGSGGGDFSIQIT